MNKKELRKKRAYDSVLEELKVLQKLDHPNVIWLEEIIDDPKKDSIYLATEYHSKGSLGDKVSRINEAYRKKCLERGQTNVKKVGLNQKGVLLYFIDMLKALYYCHKIIKVIHRDIKPDNIMINHNNEAVLIDFGVCELVDQQDDDFLTKKKGSYMFFAPEMFKEDKCIKGESTDIWALGVTLFYLVTGQFPFDENSNLMKLHDMVLNDPINFDLIKNKDLRNLLERILEKDPDQRATLEEILQNEWVTSNG